jgi:hypothetical protein
MGTNYYSVRHGVEELDSDAFWALRDEDSDNCLHIGKSSLGWCFSLHVIPERGINTLTDWIRVFIDPERVIVDEYRSPIDLSQIMRVITARGRQDPCTWDQERLDRNYAEPGPNNLVRHRIDPENGCVGHGEGTWDYITGRYS